MNQTTTTRGTRYKCHDCGDTIPTGLAHLRSVSLERIVLCGFCLDLRRIAVQPTPAPVPTQRSRGTLSERLAAARVAS